MISCQCSSGSWLVTMVDPRPCREVAPLLGGDGSKSPVVEDQKLDARQAFEEPGVMAVAACKREHIEQSR